MRLLDSAIPQSSAGHHARQTAARFAGQGPSSWTGRFFTYAVDHAGNLLPPGLEERSETGLINRLGIAEKLHRVFGQNNWVMDPQKFGMSLEDIAGAISSFISVAIPQCVAAILSNRSKWERISQTVLGLAIAPVFAKVFKNEKFGTNTFFDQFMKPKIQQLPKESSLLQRWINPFRMEHDYFDILDRAGVVFSDNDRKKAFWSALDSNQRALIDGLCNKLTTKFTKNQLSAEEERILKSALAFRTRLSIFPLLSSLLIAASSVYVSGHLLTKFVLTFIAPLDNPNTAHGSVKEFFSLLLHPEKRPKSYKQLSIRPPQAFSRVAQSAFPPSSRQPVNPAQHYKLQTATPARQRNMAYGPSASPQGGNA